MYDYTHYSKETLWGVFKLMGQQIKLKCFFHQVLYWINAWKHNLKVECGAALMAILLAWPSAMQPQTMSRPELGRPIGWGLSMAGSLAINIYSVSRVVNTPGAWAAQSGRKSQHTHTHRHSGVLSAPFSHPVQLQHGQTDWTLRLLFLTS